tara:strand:+ start:31 stop:288 length:258 start_codon:yes stop_codon:yes gene_type:complete
MTPWREGDPVGIGEVYLPDDKHKKTYSLACKRLIIESAAFHVLKLKTIDKRREFINSYPQAGQADLKSRVKELWGKANNGNSNAS